MTTEQETVAQLPEDSPAGERLQKVLAQAGVGSRRAMEEWIIAGRVTVNGELATLGMRVVEEDVLRVDNRIVRINALDDSLPRVLLYHKQEGEIVSRDDPEKRANVFDKLPKVRGMKWIAIGRLDFNTSGLLIFTSSGDLANRLMHPRFEVEREYAVRVQGSMTEEQMKLMLNDGILLEDGPVKFEKLLDEGGEGYNHWYRLIMKEGRNRVVRRTFEALGLPVSRLMRVRFGMINLPPRLKRGMLAELGPGEVKMILEWVGIQIPLNLPQVSPDQHNNKRLERKPIPKSTRSGKQEDKSGETHKAKQRNDAPAALRNKSSVSRMKTGKQR
jgi:23S rRNA pseudouridine2605 synthase